jgi:mono/diheme cytochrome c family protein
MAARAAALALGLVSLAAAGCRQDMHDQPKYKPYRRTDFFGDARSERPLVEDTVARGQLRVDAAYFTGKQGQTPIEAVPVALTPALMARGQERFGIYCTPCHGQTGRGDGMVVQRGYRRPPSFHIDRLRNEKDGYFFDVVTSGFGAMPDYSAQVPVADRWAIVAYIRALQLSENARMDDVPPEHRAEVATGPAVVPAPAMLPGAPLGAPASAPPPSARPVSPERRP